MCGFKKKIGMGEGVVFLRISFGNLLYKFNMFDFLRKGGGFKICVVRCLVNIFKLKKNIII